MSLRRRRECPCMRLTRATWNKARKLAKLLAHRDYRAALKAARVAAAVEHERLLKTLDCRHRGRHRRQSRPVRAGVATLLSAGATIISFEPLAAPAARFRAVLGDDPYVTLIPVAIGDRAQARPRFTSQPRTTRHRFCR